MAPIDVTRAIPIAAGSDFEHWLAKRGTDEREILVAIHNRRSGRQTIGLVELQEIALCHGWVDSQTKRIDGERYAIRFVPRRPGSNWSPKNREMARRMVAGGRVTDAGRATLPLDL